MTSFLFCPQLELKVILSYSVNNHIIIPNCITNNALSKI